MIVLITPEYNPSGNIAFLELAETDLTSLSRRISKRKTIDGGVFLDDMGFSEGDRTLTITTLATVATYSGVANFIKNFNTYFCSTAEGVFKGTISGVKLAGNIATITFLVKDKVI